MGTRFLTLSLFIMMLSFFIVLNSFSTFETSKTRNLLQSVTEKFSTRPPGTSFIPPLQAAGGDTARNPLERLDMVLQTEEGEGQIKANRLRTAMKIRLPLDEFEAMIARDGMEGRDFLPVLSGVLEQGTGGYTLKMVFNVNADFARMAAQNPQGASAAIVSAARLVQMMQDAGLPRESISAAIGNGPEQTIDLFFKRRGSSAPAMREG